MNDLSRRTAWLWLVALVALPLAARIVLAASLELAPDEAYYAAWARHPALCYLDHPPMVAWLIAGSVALLGESALAVRLPALVTGAALPLLLYATARVVGASRRASLLATAAGSLTLLLAAGGLLVTPDAPLSLAVAAAVYFLARAAFNDRAPSLVAAGAAGAALAFGFASKLTTGLFAAWALVAARPLPFGRRLLAVGIGLVGLLPVLTWNAERDWPMFTFHGARVAARSGPSLATLGEFLGGQVGLLCVVPALLVGLTWVAGLRRGASAPLRFLTTLSAGPVLSVAALSVFTRVEPNWIAPAYLPAFVAVALWLDVAPRRGRLALAAAAVGGAITVAAQLHAAVPYLPLPAEKDPSAQLHGWSALASAVRAERGPRPVLASRYQEASELAFYLPDREVSTLPFGARPSTFDLWPAPAREAASALCVWLRGEAHGRAMREVEVAGRRYQVGICKPARWRDPPPLEAKN